MAALGRGVARNGLLDEEGIGKTLRRLPASASWRGNALKKPHRGYGCGARCKTARHFSAGRRTGPETPAAVRIGRGRTLWPRGYFRIPAAKGVAADLGGGSLELTGVARGAAGAGVSLPLGVLRVGSDPRREDLSAAIKAGIKGSRLKDAAKIRTSTWYGGLSVRSPSST
jgi:exopolyphosphatase/guanosine-5'-triphosphate,3'-diphosphate pyrophosphatase